MNQIVCPFLKQCHIFFTVPQAFFTLLRIIHIWILNKPDNFVDIFEELKALDQA